MKKFLLFAGACLLIMAMLSLSSCRKADLPCDPRNGNAEFTQCVIREINNFPTENGLGLQRIFTYNSKGDPILGEPPYVSTGSPRWVFNYDKKGRLVTFAGMYNSSIVFEFWHNYKYDQKDRIISDSLFVFGLVANPGATADWRHSQLSYDNLNRVVKEVRTSFNQIEWPDFTAIYTYDAAGNLDGAHAEYDNKVNPLLTNKIWRFLARDYSINNRYHPSAYNSNGLPTLYSYNDSTNTYFPLFWNIYGQHINIIYDCGDDHHPGHY